MKDFRGLIVWRKSHELTLEVYALTKLFPKEELFGLSNQMRQSSSSIPTNIAEGSGRGSNADFQRFLQMAFGSASELDYQLLLCRDLTYMAESRYMELYESLFEVKKMLASLIRKIQSEK